MTSEKTYRIIHTLQAVTGTIVGIGMFLLIGTCGSLECDTISLGTAFIRLVVITLVGAPFAYALNYLTEIERSLRAPAGCALSYSSRSSRQNALVSF